jgi:peptide/nickel transport system permease protein
MSNDDRAQRGDQSFEVIPTVQGIDAEGSKSTAIAVESDPHDDKSYSQGQLVRRRFFRHKGAMTSLVVLAVVFVVAFTSIGIGPIPGWWPHDYSLAGTVVNGGSPSWAHPFGQDTVG